MDAPGLKVEDIDVQINGNLLTVSGQRAEEKEEKGRMFHRIERRHGTFSRTITLPCAVNDEKVDAQYRDGVLRLTLPKTEESKAHKIAVKA
jgi:HSP20 family protein